MELSARPRNRKGNQVKSLRRDGLIPGVIFSKKSSQGKDEVLNIVLGQKIFDKVYQEAGETNLVTIDIEDTKKTEVLISNVQVDPVTLQTIHASFYEVDLTEEIDTEIPVVIINEDECIPVKNKTGIVITVLNEIAVRSLPKDIPSEFEVDVSVLQEVNDVLTVDQAVNVDKDKVEILSDLEEIVVKIDYAEQLEVEEEEEMTVDDIEVTTEKPDEDGDEDGEAAKPTEKANEEEK